MKDSTPTGLILVVDDTPANLTVMSEALTDAGYDVAAALSGDRALKQIQHRLPDLILLDIQMPGIDGFETCCQLKANPDAADIPVIFMTALSDAASKVKAFDLGAVDYVTKPFQEAEVLARVSTHLKLRQLTQSLEQQVAARTQELTNTLETLKQSQLQLIQQEKFSALGGLVAGVAHEINNPLGFIAGNLDPAQNYVQDILELLARYQQHFPDPGDDIGDYIEEVDLEYIREDLPKLLVSMREGTNRIRAISRSLRSFSHADGDRKMPYDLRDGMESTLMILKHRLKATEDRPKIQVMKAYNFNREVECFPSQINQVFMNLLANAIDALEDDNQGRSFEEIEAQPNQIFISTELSADQQSVVIRIGDNGTGMPAAIQAQIFDHFTTKPLGKGTGLGLSISHQIVVKNHQGTIEVHSELNQGTKFEIRLPLMAP
ncbi:MAG: response regulator [Leptolyngbya sp. SIOISBB]|nr:response regulator [Leptolyngbya sp. SIOISBB]